MKAKILVRILTPAMFTVLLVLLTIPPLPEAQTLTSGTYVYTLRADGSADVSIILSNVSGQTTIYVKVDPGILPESLIAVNEKGDIIPTSIVSSAIVQAIPANQSTQLFIRYEAIVGEVSGSLVKDIIAPGGPAIIRLPAGGALLYFNGTPSLVKMIGNQIVIEYSNAGTYEIEFTLPPPTTTTTSSPTTTTSITTTKSTTTPTSTTATSTTATPTTTTSTATQTQTSITSVTTTSASTSTTSSTTSVTTTASPQTTTTQASTTSVASTTTSSTSHQIPATSTTLTTSTTSMTAGSSTTTSTTSSTTRTTTTKTTSTSPTTGIIETHKTRPNSSSTSNTITTKPQPSQSNTAWTYALAALAVIIAIATALVLRSRSASRGKTWRTGASELIHAEELDERDYEILKALKEETETISSLARKLGLSKSVVWRRVQKLLRLGLISKEDKGGRTYLSITEEGLKKLGGQA